MSLLVVGSCAVASGSAPAWARGVEARLPANAGSHGGTLSVVSCASAGNCTAVGSYTDSSGREEGLLLTETAGTWARGVEARLPRAAGKRSHVVFYAVSCASPGNCAAVGTYSDSGGIGEGLLLTESAGRWAQGVQAPLPTNARRAGRDAGAVVGSVSCASAGDCTAVGSYTDSSDHSQGLLLTERAGRWASGLQAPLPASGTAGGLQSVSCASAGDCTAVGSYNDSSDHSQQGLLLTEKAGRWARGVQAPLPADASTTPGVADAGVGGYFASTVSCASAGNCSAVGAYVDKSRKVEGLLLTETAGRWARGVQAQLPANASTTVARLTVSCASAGNCTAVGSYTDSLGDEEGLLLTETAGRWARGVQASPPADAGKQPGPGVLLFSVSCASAGTCTAVGSYTDRSTKEEGMVLTQTAGRWSRGVQARLPANADTTPDAVVLSVSCPPAGSCAAVGSYTDKLHKGEGLLLTQSPGA